MADRDRVAGRASIGILVLDSIDLPHRALAGDYDALFTALLERDDLEVTIHDGHSAELPDPKTCDGWLLPGSRSSVNDEEPWLPAVREWTAEILETRRAIAGVCFGHQLIADLLGAPVGPAEVGWNIGAVRYQVRGQALGATLDVDHFTLLASHQDQVSELPDGATLIASANRCPVAAYSVDDHVLCVQAHPEWVPTMAASIYQARVERLGAAAVARALSTLDTPLDRELIGNWLTTAARRR